MSVFLYGMASAFFILALCNPFFKR